MNNRPYSRGHERADHRDLKLTGRLLLLRSGCDMACCELHGADVIGYRKTGTCIQTIAVEYERTVKHVIPNIRRNLLNQVDVVVTAGMTPRVTAAAARLIERRLTPDERKRVCVVFYEDLTEAFLGSLVAATTDNGEWISWQARLRSQSHGPIQQLTTTEGVHQ